MPCTNQARRLMMETFGTTEFEDATKPYRVGPISDRDVIRAKAGRADHCAAQQAIGSDPHVEGKLVFNGFTYLKFVGLDAVQRYQNSDELREEVIIPNDKGLWEDVVTGVEYVLDAPKGARRLNYSKNRREAIKTGTHVPRRRGPNKKPREKVEHTRTF